MVTRTALTDGFVLLRPIDEADFEQYCEAAGESFAEVSRWMPWSADLTKEEVHRLYVSGIGDWEAGTSYVFNVFDPQDRSYLGVCFLAPVDSAHKAANLGYWVRTSRTKRGVATAATRLLACFGLEEIGLLRIELVIATANLASQRVAETSGAVREGVLRNRMVVRDKVHDAIMYSITRSDNL